MGRKEEESNESSYRPCRSIPSFAVVRPLESFRHLLRGTPTALSIPSRSSKRPEARTAESESANSHSRDSPSRSRPAFEFTGSIMPYMSLSPLTEIRSYSTNPRRVRRRQTSRTISRRLSRWRPTFLHPTFSLQLSIHSFRCQDT